MTGQTLVSRSAAGLWRKDAAICPDVVTALGLLDLGRCGFRWWRAHLPAPLDMPGFTAAAPGRGTD